VTLLHVEGLRKSFAANPVLRGVGLDVPAGAIVALLGSSGCGKTTLLRLVAGFEAADAGRITLGGRVLDEPGLHVPAEQRRIGYVPQEGTLFPHLTVAGNVGFGVPRAGRAARVAEVLRLTGLSELAGRYPHQISGGQQQRTALARALAPDPRLVLLDEPFNALDLDLRRSVCADVVAMLREAGATALLVTHDPQEAFASADLLAVMEKGAVSQFGTPAEIYNNPASLAVARLTGDVVLLPATRQGSAALTELGPVALHDTAAPGDSPALLMIRPEQLLPCAEGGILATVVGRDFRGDHWLVTASHRETMLRLKMPGDWDAPPGTPLRLAVHGRGILFPRD
jgi:iron(III) transport system ATP-binding protein